MPGKMTAMLLGTPVSSCCQAGGCLALLHLPLISGGAGSWPGIELCTAGAGGGRPGAGGTKGGGPAWSFCLQLTDFTGSAAWAGTVPVDLPPFLQDWLVERVLAGQGWGLVSESPVWQAHSGT